MSGNPREVNDTGKVDPRIDDWPVAGNSQAEFVGTTATGDVQMPVFYDEEENVFFGTEADEANEQFRRLPDQEWVRDPTETLGEGIERLGDALGWESLSEFAESHLEDDEN